MAVACSGEAELPLKDVSVPCSTRTLGKDDGACYCPTDDVLCPTRGYAHFTISNVEGSGLPNEAVYDTTDGLVHDVVTELYWERVPSDDYFGWDEARTRCQGLGLEGRSDFRLPGRIELVTLLDFHGTPAIASAFEERIPSGSGLSDYYWSSSPGPFVEGSAYSVYFGAGETTIADASPGRAHARCVAGAVPAMVAPNFEIRDEVVSDLATGLEWERAFAAPLTLLQAAARCESLGMRLPSIRELQSIVDENSHMPAIDLQRFPGVKPEGFWSSTFRGDEQPWYVDFADGKTHADRFPNETLASRCVSSFGKTPGAKRR